jgi:hypothetical protein
MFCTKYAGKKHKKVKPNPEKSENVGNFYTARVKLNRSDEEQFRNRRGDYGNKPHPEGGIAPFPLSGTIEF